MFCKKGVLRNFAKFIGKHLCQSLFFNKVAGGTFFTEHVWATAFLFKMKCFLVSLLRKIFQLCLTRLYITHIIWWRSCLGINYMSSALKLFFFFFFWFLNNFCSEFISILMKELKHFFNWGIFFWLTLFWVLWNSYQLLLLLLVGEQYFI